MGWSGSGISLIVHSSYGINLRHHLVPTLSASREVVTVAAFLCLDTHRSGGLHLELVHGGTGLGNVDLVASPFHQIIHLW